MCKRTFRYSTETVTAIKRISDFCSRSKTPLFLRRKRFYINTAFQKVTCFFSKQRQRVLKSVIYLSQKTRSKPYSKHFTGKLYFVSCFNAFCHFINLHLGNISANTDNFAFKLFIFYIYIADFIHSNVSVKFDRNHVTINSDYFSFCISHVVSPSISS